MIALPKEEETPNETPRFSEGGRWAGLFAPAKTSEPILLQLREAVGKAMADPQTIKIFESAGSVPAYQDAPEFAHFVEADGARLIAAVRKIGKVD